MSLLVIMTIATASASFYYIQKQEVEMNNYKEVIMELNRTIEDKEELIQTVNASLKESILKNEQLNKKITFFEKNISKLERAIASLEESLTSIKTSKGVVNPDYNTLINFLQKDHTERRNYDYDFYDCTDFSNTFVKNFNRQGYYSCNVELEFEDSGHIIVGVMTTDKGLVFIEPQDDTLVWGLKAGKDYCDLVNWDCEDPWLILDVQHCFQ